MRLRFFYEDFEKARKVVEDYGSGKLEVEK